MASPIKRRVLASLDANSIVTTAPPLSLSGKPAISGNCKLPLSTPSSAVARKRTLHEILLHEEPAVSDTSVKKPCVGGNSATSTTQPRIATVPTNTARPSSSPKLASIDLSVMVNASQASNLTGPDAETPRVANASGKLTREQSRQRAEILKLRLGLARYKVRTGQIDVPLEHLRIVPSAYDSQRQQQQQRTLPPKLQERSKGECVEHQQKRTDASASARTIQHSLVPQHRYLSCPTSPSAGGAPSSQGRGRDRAQDNVSATSGSDREVENENDGDQLDSRPLPQQPPHRLDAVDVIEDSDVSNDASGRTRDNGDSDGGDEEETEDEGDLLQLPQIRRRLSPLKRTPGGKRTLFSTPRGNRHLAEDGNGGHLDRLTSSAMRGSAVNGLLSLARS
ncbi:hypothetical protein SEPCBS57363_003543 [Sporothrix epigloea]|uniref:Cyclin-dependent kinase n=1 Tax=Sporothrix epigloea TaxID=1892477 RepID=A0ABP0DPT3_9PEZI